MRVGFRSGGGPSGAKPSLPISIRLAIKPMRPAGTLPRRGLETPGAGSTGKLPMLNILQTPAVGNGRALRTPPSAPRLACAVFNQAH